MPLLLVLAACSHAKAADNIVIGMAGLNFSFLPFQIARARCWTIHQAYFVRNRRDCWALAMGQAPLDVKREIWLHEQDELISDPRAAGEDHYTLTTKEAKLLGVSEADIDQAELHPFVVAALEAWLHLGKKTGSSPSSRYLWWRRSIQVR